MSIHLPLYLLNIHSPYLFLIFILKFSYLLNLLTALQK
jgi:hypothetical protein